MESKWECIQLNTRMNVTIELCISLPQKDELLLFHTTSSSSIAISHSSYLTHLSPLSTLTHSQTTKLSSWMLP